MPTDIFELEIITFSWDMDYLDPYPAFKISKSSRYLFQHFEEADFQIKELAKKSCQEEIYRFILRQLPLNERLYVGNFNKLYIYDAHGKLLDHSLCSDSEPLDKQNEFKGRPENLIRFQKGDIVEWFDSEKAHLGIVTGVPLTPNGYIEIMERFNKRHSKITRDWFFDCFDDTFTIIDNPDLASHEHVFAPFVSKPTFFVPGKLRRKLEEAYQKVDNVIYK